jgi:type IV secretory pathway protease TraF
MGQILDGRPGVLVAANFDSDTIQKAAVLKEVGSVAVDPANQGGAGFFNQDITITGVDVGDLVFVQPPATLEDTLRLVGVVVQSANTVRLRLEATGAVNGASRVWQYQVWSKTK